MRVSDQEPHQHSEAEYEEVAAVLKALGHPLRVKIVCGLLREPCTQTHISASLGIPQSSVAQHVEVLRRRGIVQGRRQGTEVLLSIADPRVAEILRGACRHGETPVFEWGKAAAARPSWNQAPYD
jgi:ArsR family transcriptional regulator